MFSEYSDRFPSGLTAQLTHWLHKFVLVRPHHVNNLEEILQFRATVTIEYKNQMLMNHTFRNLYRIFVISVVTEVEQLS